MRQQARAERAARDSRRRRRVTRLLPQALVVATLAGGTSAFVADGKRVTLEVDGKPRTVYTHVDTVAELLEADGVDTGARDEVRPAPHAELRHGDEITVRHARPLVLTVDGRRRTVWTTARTVDEALSRLMRERAEGAYVSASRSSAIGRDGLKLDVHTERDAVLVVAGEERRLRTRAATVAELLRQAGVRLGGEDTVSRPLGSFPRDGMRVEVERVRTREGTRIEAVPYEVVTRRDPSLADGTRVVEQAGREGARRITYRTRTVTGESVRRSHERLDVRILRAARPQIVRVGTRPSAPAAAPAGAVPGTGGLNWASLAACESGGRPGATDATGTYGGLYQFDLRTWQGVGGSGRPQDASAAEQTYRAQKLYQQRGAAPWPVCGRNLYG
ncbi:ubiquitin-like domain-containing protein [Streptomyces polyrhachis]|uniref:Ubiquitin-like domain-containing protein n=1 Tax=Streptomyces polyrhachis TaxID=1282885 RepID=A0ABW2GKE7_9ACTN